MAISSEAARRPRESLIGMTLDTRGGSYIFTKVLYRRPDRYVVKAQRTDASERANAPPLVIKLSPPSTARTIEEKLVNKARVVAIDAGGDSHWVLQHLPRILHSEDLPIIPGSTQAHVAEILHTASCNTCEEDCDENRTLRIVIMEELLPIGTLRNASEFAQVFFDVLNCHKWLYDNPRILHRDISMSNIMYRRGDDGAVYGVLNDMDLSSFVADLEATSFMRTGTPPFMAVDLLRSHNSETVHLYRHDLESLFYVMLILSTRHQLSCNGLPQNILVQRVSPSFSDWFSSSLTWQQLGIAKDCFIKTAFRETMSVDNLFPPDSSFVGFRNWIIRLKFVMSLGFNGLENYYDAIVMARVLGDTEGRKTPFDEKTLGGKIQYSTFFDVMKSFAGKELRAPPVNLGTVSVDYLYGM
ncbi:hypothetical protein CPB85DRAFT_1560521 [Mucidula mucida]|nr:hypothetical protein CPB85DRAFT_1560521 [Mucidula mucida]